MNEYNIYMEITIRLLFGYEKESSILFTYIINSNKYYRHIYIYI